MWRLGRSWKCGVDGLAVLLLWTSVVGMVVVWIWRMLRIVCCWGVVKQYVYEVVIFVAVERADEVVEAV